MSLDFWITCDVPPSKDEVAEAAGPEVARGDGGKGLANDWGAGPVLLWLPGRSTRYTSISYAGGMFAISIHLGATAEDRGLAARMAERLAVRCACDAVDADNVGRVLLVDLPGTFDREWAAASEKGGFEDVISYARNNSLAAIIGGGPLALPGPMGAFHIGPRLIKALQERAGETELWRDLKQCMLEFHNPAVPHATVLSVGSLPKGKAPTLVVWYPDKAEVVSKADYVTVGLGPLPTVTWDGFLKLAKGRSRLVDEDQPLVEAYEPGDLPALIKRARSMDRTRKMKRAARGFNIFEKMLKDVLGIAGRSAKGPGPRSN